MKQSEDPDFPLEHVYRPYLPWRPMELTECGLETEGKPMLERAEFLRKVARQGKTRAAMTTCITCWQTAERWADWNTSPSHVVFREVRNAGYYAAETIEVKRIDAELRAIAALIAAHRDEFDTFLTDLGGTVDLTAERQRRRRRSRRA